MEHKASLLTNLGSPFRIRQNTSDTWTAGSGPARIAYHGALNLRVRNVNRWTLVGEGPYHTLNLSTGSNYVSDADLLQYKLDGALAALTVFHLLAEPHPINPFLLYATCVQNGQALRENIRPFIGMIFDPMTRQLVLSIMKFKATTIVDSSEVTKHPVTLRGLELDGIHGTFFERSRQLSAHNAFIEELLCVVLLGHPNPWSHKLFKAFRDGFNLRFLKLDNLITHKQEDPELFALKFIATLYEACINSPSDVWKRIKFIGCQCKSTDAHLYFRLFLIRLYRWFHGQGHPRELVGTQISQESYDAGEKHRHILRAQLFWKAATDFEVLPVGLDTRLTVTLSYKPELGSDKLRTHISFHTCPMTAEVLIDGYVINLLLQPGTVEDETSSAFDLWWHSQIVHAAGDYNRV
ncbi:hypothetical protein AX14_008662 [Amanita brunnescens Koide BX004]|nr:hypothetical protein AX14_008662 [Amanita brunnescens Koide BX004]